MEQIDHGPKVAPLFNVDLEEITEVIERRASAAQVVLLLHGSGLSVSLRDDQPTQLGPIFSGNILPDRLTQVVAKRNLAV